MPFALLLAMQASGMVIDYFGQREQQRIGNMGLKLQQAGIQSNLYQTRLEAEDESLKAMQALRKNLGTQLAVFAARGTNTAGGSAVSLFQESISNFNSDERMRRMNLLGRENELKAGGTIAKLNQQGTNTKMWSSFASRSLNRFPSSLEGWEAGFKSAKGAFGLTSSE
jgi:hypothetical protein